MRLLTVLACALVLAGCGAGAGEPAGGAAVSITVTDGFGAREIGAERNLRPPAGETVMRLLQRTFDTTTKDGGGFVTAIEGLAGKAGSRPVDWFYYVNGVEASMGAAATKLNAGDRVWWDRHEWGAAMRIPAIVGSFPEPFLSGTDGKRIPVRLDCAEQEPCDAVQERLEAVGVDQTSRAAIGRTGGQRTLRVVVGTWTQLREDPVASQLAQGPGSTGVFARFAPDGTQLELLDARGDVARRLGPGTGLVAATSFEDYRPTWLVTGTDATGVRAAAAALDEATLRNRFAVALDGGRPVALPVAGSAR